LGAARDTFNCPNGDLPMGDGRVQPEWRSLSNAPQVLTGEEGLGSWKRSFDSDGDGGGAATTERAPVASPVTLCCCGRVAGPKQTVLLQKVHQS